MLRDTFKSFVVCMEQRRLKSGLLLSLDWECMSNCFGLYVTSTAPFDLFETETVEVGGYVQVCICVCGSLWESGECDGGPSLTLRLCLQTLVHTQTHTDNHVVQLSLKLNVAEHTRTHTHTQRHAPVTSIKALWFALFSQARQIPLRTNQRVHERKRAKEGAK